MAEREVSTEPGAGRSLRWALYSSSGYLTGLSVVFGAGLAGDLTLLGDTSQAFYVIGGLIAGGVLLTLLAGLLRSRGLAAHFGVGLLGIGLATVAGVANYYAPVVTDTELLLRGALSAGIVAPVAVFGFYLASSPPFSRVVEWWRMGVVAALGITGLVFLGALLYIEEDFSYFPLIVLALAAVGILPLAAVFLGLRRVPSPRRISPTPSPLPRPGKLSRDPFVVGMALVLGVALGTWGGASLSAYVSQEQAPGPCLSCTLPPVHNITPIQHVVMIMMENHAFDNFFGIYPYDPATASNGIAANLTAPENLLSMPTIPSYLSAVSNGTYSTPDPVEGYSAYHLDVDGGKMDGFLEYSGPPSVTYYTSSQVAPEWDWAEEYGLADHDFSSMLTETDPNRLYTLCGFSPVINDYGPPPYIPSDQCIFSQLSHAGLSYAYYLDDPSTNDLGIIQDIEGVSDTTPWVQSWSDFFGALSTDTLPQVSWMEPIDGGVDDTYDQEPPGSTLEGTMWLLKVVDSVMMSPEWNSTAIFITYDEGGGFYDQVVPPTVDGEPLGQRLPLLVISPYSKEDYVSHSILNHDSQIAFVEYNWNLEALNRFVGDSTLPLDFFDFAQPPRAPDVLSSAKGFPVPASVPFPFGSDEPATLAPLFPQPLQLPLGSLPYARAGSTNLTLTSLDRGIWVPVNFAVTPATESPYALGCVLLLEVVVPLVLFRRWRDRPPTPA